MTSAERLRRFIARIRERAATPPAPASTPPPAAPDGLTIRLRHLAIDPVRTAQWIRRELGDNATRALRDALDQTLAGGAVAAKSSATARPLRP